jgi:hypothetical protein
MLRSVLAAGLALVLMAGTAMAATPTRSFDGSENNTAHPTWGKAGVAYRRLASAVYADGKSAMVSGPNARYISNRIFNDTDQNLFSENGISQWAWAWGQFLDHDMGLRDESSGGAATIPFDANDPLEAFRDDLGGVPFDRTPAAPGTGTSNARQQINTISSFIDGSQVYGIHEARRQWLLAPDGASLLLPDGFLPRASDKPGAPPMDLFGAQQGRPGTAVVAGDVRANENMALTALHTLFAREHNRIVAALPASLSAADKYQIARRVVGAEIQYITYTAFLPTLGVKLPAYSGYKSKVNATLGNEFATVGFRGHSMVHGEFEPTFPDGTFSQSQLDAFEARGIEVEHEDGRTILVISLSLAFGNPDLLETVGLGPFLASLAEVQYKNDEQIDNTLRSVLFQVPGPGVDPSTCTPAEVNPDCFNGVVDLGAADVMRARDHGIPGYNALRKAFGLDARRSFTAITGEKTDSLGGLSIDDPRILEFTQLRAADGSLVEPSDPNAPVPTVGVRRTTLAARLKAIFGSVDRIDAFTGMVSEKHVAGSDLGPLEMAMWKTQFTALRDGDRFFYARDPELDQIRSKYGITFKHTLAELMKLDANQTVAKNVFLADG